MFSFLKSKKEYEEKASNFDERKTKSLDNNIDLLVLIFNPNSNAKDLANKSIDAELLNLQGYDIGKFDERYRKDENWTVKNLVNLKIFGDDYKKLGFKFDNFFEFHPELLTKDSCMVLGIVGNVLYELGFTFDNFFYSYDWTAKDLYMLELNGDLLKKLGFTYDNFFQYHWEWSARDYEMLHITNDNFPDNLKVRDLEQKGFNTELIDIILHNDEDSNLPEALRYRSLEDAQELHIRNLCNPGDIDFESNKEHMEFLQRRFRNVMQSIIEDASFLRITKFSNISHFMKEGKLESDRMNEENEMYAYGRFMTGKNMGLYFNSNDIKKDVDLGIDRTEAIKKKMYICGILSDKIDKPIEQYGDTIIKLNKEALKNRTTFIFGNSFAVGSAASKITNPNVASMINYFGNKRAVKNTPPIIKNKNQKNQPVNITRRTAYHYEYERKLSIKDIDEKITELEINPCVESVLKILDIPYIELQFNDTIPFNGDFIEAIYVDRSKGNEIDWKNNLSKLSIPLFYYD